MINKALIEQFLNSEHPLTVLGGKKDFIGMIDCNNSKEYLHIDEFIYYFCGWIEEQTKKNVKKERKSSKKA